MVTNCCVCGVEKGSMQDLDFSFHSFPKNENLKLKWLEAIGKKVYRNAHICSKHFKTIDYKNYEDLNLVRKILKPSAVPSIHIKLSKKLKPIENFSSDAKDISIESKNDERLQIDGSSQTEVSTIKQVSNINNQTSKRAVNNKAMLHSNQTKKRIIENNTLKSFKKQRYQNGILGIVRKDDFINENAWLRFQKYINKIKKQFKLLSRKNQKLHYEISNFKDLLKKQLSDNVLETKIS